MKGNLMVRLMTALILVAIVLAHFSGQTDLLSANWLWLAIFPAFMGLQATFTGICPAELIGKFSKTGECCPGGACSTSTAVAAKEKPASSCCGSSKTDSKSTPCCGSEETAENLTEKTTSCCDNTASNSEKDGLLIKVLGTGCANCNNTVKIIEKTAQEQQVAVNVVKVEEISEIASYGVMSTPAVVIDDKVVHNGGVPSATEIKKWLK